MSNPEGNGQTADAAAFARLEEAVGGLLEALHDANQRVAGAEARVAELSALLQRFTGDEEEAGRIVGRLKTLEAENVDLRARLDRGRAGVDRMLARIRFLENQ